MGQHKSMCSTCHAGCCRAFHLVITAFDALHIARELSMPVGEFVTLQAVDDATARAFGEVHTPIHFADQGQGRTPHFVTLKRVDSKLLPGTQKCYFLTEWQRAEPVAQRHPHPGSNVLARCAIYSARPRMCRVYPANLHKDGAIGFVSTPLSAGIQQQHDIYRLCPEPWTHEQFAADLPEPLHHLVLERYERDFQNRVVQEWNKAPRPAAHFFPHMAEIYARRFRTAPAAAAGPAVVLPAAPPAGTPRTPSAPT